MERQRLSRMLYKLSGYDTAKLRKLSDRNLERLNDLIQRSPLCRKEYALIGTHMSSNPGLFLIAIEYEIDDGRLTHGCGDALLFDGTGTLFVLECKSLTTVDGRDVRPCKRIVRLDEIRQQTKKYADRIRSWIQHLSGDPLLSQLSAIHVCGQTLTDDGTKKLDQPGIEPGSPRQRSMLTQ